MSPTSGKTILILDDDIQMTKALSVRLGALGFRCVTACTGSQGVAIFGKGGIDLVISDLNMPSGDGVAFAQAIRRTSDVPIIFVTGFRDEFKRRLRDVPNVTTLRKPFDAQHLVELVACTLASTPVTAAATALEES